ncbi:PP2C family serine/threonine-protein phosphatase [Ruminococcus sp.]|uniref:PP2C family serine/threonine-protein phosphatase n=1 Tax=Ruminococcus sp. TaxID=41978 RepID=UPI001B5A45A3|nr:PP2C family serine/threonine-protein phosphatase [Ruminococcus sp.]MBP5434037.1 protein phosphatase 2C domain-containing protein [Ruminococcus sp.]
MFNGFSHSVMGASHEKTNLVCQDSSAFKIGDHYAVAVVADGHGSKKHFRSHIGSKFAVEAAIEAIDRYYEDREALEANLPENHKLIIKNIEKQIISNWNVRIEKHLAENPVTEEERSKFTEEEFEAILPESYYGSTLVVAVAGDNYTFGVQIGDGSLVAIFEDGKAVMPMEYNEAAPANVTASVCNSNAAGMFSSFYTPNKKLIALYGSTDGLYTSFGSEYDFLDYHTIITSQLINLETFKTVIKNNLSKRSRFGTEDDISLSCIYDEDLIKENLNLINQRVAENREAAAERKAAALSKQVEIE